MQQGTDGIGQVLWRYVRKMKVEPGYDTSRRMIVHVKYTNLGKELKKMFNIPFYNGGLDSAETEKELAKCLEADIEGTDKEPNHILLATTAAAYGISYKQFWWLIHLKGAYTAEMLYQQSSRVSRDGEGGVSYVLLASEHERECRESNLKKGPGLDALKVFLQATSCR
jgi:superfamily II DNA helicase RecQ